MQSQHVNDTTRLKTLGWEEDLVAPPAQGGHSPMAVLTEGNALVNARTQVKKRQAWAYQSAAAFPSTGYRSAASLRTGSPRSKNQPSRRQFEGGALRTFLCLSLCPQCHEAEFLLARHPPVHTPASRSARECGMRGAKVCGLTQPPRGCRDFPERQIQALVRFAHGFAKAEIGLEVP